MPGPLPRIATATALTAVVVGGLTALAAPAGAASPAVLRVVVLSPAGDPVPDVQVATPEGASAFFTAQTDSRGGVTWADAPSDVTLCATLRQDQELASPSGWAQACHDYRVSGSTSRTLHFSPGAAIGGLVTDARTGVRVAGAGVLFRYADEFLSASSDSTGHYLVRNLDPGTLRNFQVSGGAATSAAPHGYSGGAVTPWPTVTAGRVLSVPIRDTPTVRYSGTVVDGSGVAVPNASVLAGDEFGQTTVTTDAAGTYQLDRPWSPGGEDIDPAACAWAGRTAAHPTGLAVVCTSTLTSGVTVHDRFALAGEGGSLVGTVVRPGGGRPGAGTAVGVPVIGGPSGYVLPGVVAADGTYRIDGVAAGLQQVRATQPPGATVAFASATAAAGATRRVADIVLSNGF